MAAPGQACLHESASAAGLACPMRFMCCASLPWLARCSSFVAFCSHRPQLFGMSSDCAETPGKRRPTLRWSRALRCGWQAGLRVAFRFRPLPRRHCQQALARPLPPRDVVVQGLLPSLLVALLRSGGCCSALMGARRGRACMIRASAPSLRVRADSPSPRKGKSAISWTPRGRLMSPRDSGDESGAVGPPSAGLAVASGGRAPGEHCESCLAARRRSMAPGGFWSKPARRRAAGGAETGSDDAGAVRGAARLSRRHQCVGRCCMDVRSDIRRRKWGRDLRWRPSAWLASLAISRWRELAAGATKELCWQTLWARLAGPLGPTGGIAEGRPHSQSKRRDTRWATALPGPPGGAKVARGSARDVRACARGGSARIRFHRSRVHADGDASGSRCGRRQLACLRHEAPGQQTSLRFALRRVPQ